MQRKIFWLFCLNICSIFAQQELIQNGIFTEGGLPSILYWTPLNANASASNQIGKNGGYSAQISPDYISSGSPSLNQTVTPPESGTYNLSFYAQNASSSGAVTFSTYLGNTLVAKQTISKLNQWVPVIKKRGSISTHETLSIVVEGPLGFVGAISNVSLTFTPPPPPPPPKPPVPDPVSNSGIVYQNAVIANSVQAASNFVTAISSVSVGPLISAVLNQRETESPQESQSELSYLAGAGLESNILSGAKNKFRWQNPFHFWMRALGSYLHQAKNRTSSAYHAGSGAFLTGIDRKFQNYVVGLGVGYDFSSVHHENSSAYSNINQAGLAPYALFYFDWIKVCMSLYGGVSLNANYRTLDFVYQNQWVNSSYLVGVLAGHIDVTGGPIWENSWSSLHARVSADYAENWQDSSKEKGKSPYLTKQPSTASGFIKITTRMSYSQYFETKKVKITFREHAGWAYQRSFNSSTASVSLIGIGQTSLVPSNANIQNLFEGGGSVGFIPKNISFPSFFLDYKVAVGSKYFSQEASANLSFNF